MSESEPAPRRASSGAEAQGWIDRLGLIAHPEGGFFRESYRSPVEIPGTALPERHGGAPRPSVTAIEYLVEAGNFSALHRLRSDELWFFLAGDPLLVHSLHPAPAQGGAARYEVLRLGAGPGCALTGVVPNGPWFGAELAPGGHYALTACVVSPGFDFADFELGDRQALLAQFPGHRDLIQRLTRIAVE